MGKLAPALTRPQLAELARAALDNSAALLDDARFLLVGGRWPRAYSVAVLAAEEYGKFHRCVLESLSMDANDHTWDEFWRDFRLHKPKFAAWYGQYVDGQDWGPVGSVGDADWLREWNSAPGKAREHDRDKQAGFYVDFDTESGSIRVPADRCTEEMATELIEKVSSVVAYWAMPAGQAHLTGILFPNPRSAAFLAELRTLMSPRPPAPLSAEGLGEMVSALFKKHFGAVGPPNAL
ncbi:AbiV family abortive infection protein [Nocardia otitidiscaviarum]|uniref:AbiV family abortive infection protein n=1 Tax=Nocardia otitidiscaviarum TaxID=1823 RepID=UPI001893A4FA|nr:AbiV family abortive infection protein [Nocardia otitidiscaviarum]MBF6238710.1 AbiV family abortive infection protein [Nocardia otitidiscaviarum]